MATKNPAQISKGGRFKQGIYQPIHPEKYIGDVHDVRYRSSWEFQLCYKFDHSKEILAWGCEPLFILYRSPKDGLSHRYFIDFMTVAYNKELDKKIVTLIEVKPEKEKYPPTSKGKKKSRYLYECMQYEINQSKWKYARAYCEKRGWNFVILTEKEILGK